MYPSMKNSFILVLFLFVSLFASTSAASATEIVLGTEHHHLGDDFKEELDPGEPEGLIYTTTFTLSPSMDIESAELILTGRNLVPGPADEFSDKVYLNEIEIGALNNYFPAEPLNSESEMIKIPVHPSLFDPGVNTIKITAGSNANGSNYDDFEFYNLSLHLNYIEPVTLAPPLKVAWTYKLPWKYGWEVSAEEVLIKDGILYLNGKPEEGLIAVDAETGEPLWSKEWSASLAYKDGVLFAVHSSNVEALDSKTGELLWSKEYPEILWDNPLIFGNTLFVSTPDDRYVAAIDAEDGTLKWEYEFNTTSFETEGSNYYRMSHPLVIGNIFVSQYFAFHTIYAEPLAINPDEPEPELEEPEIQEGLICLDTKTGKEVWRYTYSDYPYDPFVYKDLLYVGDGMNILALSVESGEIVWKTKVGDWAGDIVDVKDGKILVNSYKLMVLDADTGKVLNELPRSDMPVSSSVITDKYSYSTDQYHIKVFNSSTGKTVWSSSRIKGAVVSGPTLYKDKLYLVSNEGVLYAFEHGEGGLLFTRGLENAATFYFPPFAIVGMLLVLAISLQKNNNKSLVFGLWLIALAGVLLLSLKTIEPYTYPWSLLGILSILVFFFFVPLTVIVGIAFLISGIRKRKK